jgi:hypothetical protein
MSADREPKCPPTGIWACPLTDGGLVPWIWCSNFDGTCSRFDGTGVRHEAPCNRVEVKDHSAGPSQRSGEAGGSLIRGTPGRVASGPDNGGTCRDYRTVRVRLARSEGVARANQWLKLRKQRAGSNLVDTGRYAARDPTSSDDGSTPKPDFLFRWGGHVEGLRRRRGDAAGVELGVSLTDRSDGERGNHHESPSLPDSQSGGGQARCRLMAVGGAEAP